MAHLKQREKDSDDKDEALKCIFSEMSSDGKITAEKLRTVTKDLGHDFTDDEIKEMIDVADPSGNGKVNYKSMVTMIAENKEEFPAVEMSMEEIRRELTMIRSETTMLSLKSKSAHTRSHTRNETRMSNVHEEDNQDLIDLTHRIPVAAVLDGEPTSDREDSKDNKDEVFNDPEDRASDLQDCDIPNDVDKDSDGEIDQREDASPERNGTSCNRVAESRVSHVITHTLDGGVVTALGIYQETHSDTENQEIDTKQEADIEKQVTDKQSTNLKKGQVDTGMRSLSVQHVGKKSKPGKAGARQKGTVTLVRANSVNNINHMSAQKSIPNARFIKASGGTNVVRRQVPATKRKSVMGGQGQSLQQGGLSMVKGTAIGKQPSKGQPSTVMEDTAATELQELETPAKASGFRSAMGCALKLSQVRMRQRLLYVLWRQVYDEAVKSLNEAQKQQQQQTHQKRKRRVIRRRRSFVT